MTILRRLAILASLTILAVIFLPQPVWATNPPADPTGPVMLDDTVASVRLSAATVTFIVGSLIPVVAGFLSRRNSRWTGAVMIMLNAVNSGIATWQMADGTAIISQQAIFTFVTGLIGSLAAYYGLWRPLRVTNRVIDVNGREVRGVLADVGRKG